MNSNDRFDSLIRFWAETYGLPFELIKEQVRAESNFNPRAVSRVGARGLMQLMPGTGRDMGLQYPFDPDDNLRAGCRYMSIVKGWVEKEIRSWKPQIAMISSDDLYRFALVAYNGGIGYVLRALRLSRYALPMLTWSVFQRSYPNVRVLGKAPRWKESFSYVGRILPVHMNGEVAEHGDTPGGSS